MKKENLIRNLLTKDKCIFLAYDQGLEHGPTDFNDKNVDPKNIIDIAKKGKFNALVFQKGLAEQYQKEIKKSKVPLIIKLNGKTNLVKGEPIAPQLCTVSEAIDLGAAAVGYTIYIGSSHESTMMSEFEKIEREAHSAGIPVIAWIYPRGSGIEGKDAGELLAYACRVGLELGADMVKVHWNTSPKDLEWAVKSAGKCRVVVAGGMKADEKTFLMQAQQAMAAGATGLAIGRNIWQASDPIALTKKVKKVVWT